MSPRPIAPALLAALLALGASPFVAAETAATPAAKPWTETFAMTLKGKERTYVVHNGNSYLLATVDDLADANFLDQKDVVFNAKLGRVDGTKVRFYNLPKVEAEGPLELWRTRVDGDNLYVFGHMHRVNGVQHFAIAAAENAPSDSQIIADKLAGVAPDDLNARLGVAAWARDMANTQGNRELWLVAADNIVSQVIEDASAQAETKKDVALVLQAMGWCQDLLHDIPRAARIGSAAWIRTVGGTGAEEVAKRMRRWDLEFYNGQWRPRGDALAQEFADRFAAIGWRDAEGYYKLGRWADANAEVLPRARELSYRCYQAGFRANPNHNGIRRELAMEQVSDTAGATVPQGDFKDIATGVVLVGPPGWSRTDPIDGDVTWIDPASDTALITAKLLRTQDATADFKTLWANQLNSIQSRSGFTNLSDEKLPFTQGVARKLRYSYQEGRYVRIAEMIVAQNPAGKAAVRIEASAAESEQEAVRKQLAAVFGKLVIPAASAVQAPPADGGPGKPEGKDGKKPAAPAAPAPAPSAPTPISPKNAPIGG
jgi:hypothetical protein